MVSSTIDEAERYSREVYDLGEIYGEWKDFDGLVEKIEPPFKKTDIEKMELIAESAFRTHSDTMKKGALLGLELKIRRVLNSDLILRGLDIVGERIIATLEYINGGSHKLALSYFPPRSRLGQI